MSTWLRVYEGACRDRVPGTFSRPEGIAGGSPYGGAGFGGCQPTHAVPASVVGLGCEWCERAPSCWPLHVAHSALQPSGANGSPPVARMAVSGYRWWSAMVVCDGGLRWWPAGRTGGMSLAPRHTERDR